MSKIVLILPKMFKNKIKEVRKRLNRKKINNTSPDTIRPKYGNEKTISTFPEDSKQGKKR